MMRAAIIAALASCTAAKVHYKETFDATYADRWLKSSNKVSEGTAGDWELTAGKFYGDEEADKGIKTTPDARFYSIYTDMGEPFSNDGEDLVLQFSAKHEQKLDCGGGYIKLIPASSADDMPAFGGDTPYSIMFGPDMCGSSTKRVHVIFTYKGKNLLTKKDIPCETDELTHVYTLLVKPDNTYKVFIDNLEKASGKLEDDWDFLLPRTIKDPEAKKPEDWDERAKIPDETDVKPEGYDDIPKEIEDPDAEKPEDWDDEDDGEWEAPMIPNPEFKGEWVQKQVDNPDYKGIWVAPDIDNPDFEEDDKLYLQKDLKFAGFELWQVKSGSIFDNIFVGNDLEEAKTFAEDTWGKMKDAEKAAYDAAEKEKREKEEEDRKKMEEERKALEEEDDEEEEEEKSEGKEEL